MALSVWWVLTRSAAAGWIGECRRPNHQSQGIAAGRVVQCLKEALLRDMQIVAADINWHSCSKLPSALNKHPSHCPLTGSAAPATVASACMEARLPPGPLPPPGPGPYPPPLLPLPAGPSDCAASPAGPLFPASSTARCRLRQRRYSMNASTLATAADRNRPGRQVAN